MAEKMIVRDQLKLSTQAGRQAGSQEGANEPHRMVPTPPLISCCPHSDVMWRTRIVFSPNGVQTL